MSRHVSSLAGVVLALTVVTQAMGTVLTYSDRDSFNAVVTGSTTATFDGLAASGSYSIVACPVTYNGAAISGGTIFALNDATWGTGFTGGKQVLSLSSSGNTATLPSGATAFGVDLYRLCDTQMVAKERLTVNFSDSSTRYVEVDFGNRTQNENLFVGVVSTNLAVTITSVDFGAQDLANQYRECVLDNLTYGTSTVPEPSTVTLMVMGLIGLLAYAWRKRK